ncbi:uncharacterized protein [Takifugu rubripes]|uniref:uncharacterized protein n=1 Tax=Takifugu rubripes TaxID=31033 RepID=UPI001145F660|nr:uncharacterized protein LOC115247276 [Takifugu rubripes]
MFSTFTTALSGQKQTKLSPNVKAFTQDWESDVKNQLLVTKTALLRCSREERPFLKEKAKTLNDLLNLLQGKTSVKSTNLREEMETLKTQLQHMKSDYEKTGASYALHKRLNNDLEIELNRQFKLTNDAMREKEVLLRKIQRMKELYKQRLDNSLAAKGGKIKTTSVPSMQQAAYQTLAATLSDQEKIIHTLREDLCEAEAKLSASHHTIQSMKELHSHRLETSVNIGTTTAGVPSMQKAAFETLTKTLNNQRRIITKLMDDQIEAEMKLHQDRVSFQTKEEELQKQVQTLKQKLESQKIVATRRPNIFVQVFQRLSRWFFSSQSIGSMCRWILTI